MKDEKNNEYKKEDLRSNTVSSKKPFPTKISIVAASAVAVVGIGAVALFGIFGGKNDTHTHTFGEWSIAKEATCASNGLKERFCSCGEKQTDDIPTKEHSFGTWQIAEEATCGAEGKEVRECSCGERETRSIEKHKTHDNIVIDEKINPTCKDVGWSEGKHCSVCNEVIVPQTEIGKLTTHTYTDKYDAICNVCGYERIPDCPHTSTKTTKGEDPTCTKPGYTESTTCEKCGEIIIPSKKLDPNGHTESGWITEIPATCTAEGREYKKCTVCNERLETKSIDMLPHSYGGYKIEKEATCTTAGSKYKECNNCGNRSTPETIPVLDHIESDWIVDKQPTCTESGARHKLCGRCNNIFDNENVSAIGHQKGNSVTEGRVEATCTEDGYYYEAVYCSAVGCDYQFSKTKKIIESIGHTYSDNYCTKCGAPDPYPGAIRIYSYTDLVNMKNDLSATYVLMNDIDCRGVPFVPVGADETDAFAGLFDGQGYTIYNYSTSSVSYIGIFGYNKGTIRNLNVKDFKFDITTASSGTINIGGIVGYNAGTIERCSSIDGDIKTMIDNNTHGGLICGYNSGNILNCYVTGSVSICKNQGSLFNGKLAGGITAGNTGKIDNCFVDATVRADGLHKIIGDTKYKGEAALISACNEKNGVISNCFVMGSVMEGDNRQGDICGRNDGKLINCYRDTNVVLGGVGKIFKHGTEKTLSFMSENDFYAIYLSWDSSIWDFTNVNLANKVYPKLKQN